MVWASSGDTLSSAPCKNLSSTVLLYKNAGRAAPKKQIDNNNSNFFTSIIDYFEKCL